MNKVCLTWMFLAAVMLSVTLPASARVLVSNNGRTASARVTLSVTLRPRVQNISVKSLDDKLNSASAMSENFDTYVGVSSGGLNSKGNLQSKLNPLGSRGMSLKQAVASAKFVARKGAVNASDPSKVEVVSVFY